MKSRKPVPFYDAARYPDLDSHKLERRKSGRGILHRPRCQRDACEDVSVTPGEAPMEVTHPQVEP